MPQRNPLYSASPATRKAASDIPAPQSEHTPLKEDSTRARLLAAAGRVFAEHGYSHATVRQICTRANANVAAVNYHFGDKAGLYAAVMDYAIDSGLARHRLEAAPELSPEQQLTDLVASLLRKLLDPDAPTWYSAIMARELIEPTFALDRMVDRMARPMFTHLRTIISRMIPADASAQQPHLLDRLTASVIGQCMIYKHGREVNSRLRPAEAYTPEMVEEWATHIARFSLAGLNGYFAVPAVSASPGTIPGSLKDAT